MIVNCILQTKSESKIYISRLYFRRKKMYECMENQPIKACEIQDDKNCQTALLKVKKYVITL
jgi:hypothetical protein